MRTATGLSTEAVYIFTNMLRKLAKTYKPEYMAAVFESIGPTLREQEFADYKANRTEMPDDLAEQIPYVRKVLDGMRVPILQFAGYEADDVIATLARRAESAGYEVVIVSSDKDMLQLVTDRVSMLNPAKDDLWYDPAKVEEFMGVRPRTGGRSACAQGRFGGQHSGRARHRRQRRARSDRPVRIGRAGTRTGR